MQFISITIEYLDIEASGEDDGTCVSDFLRVSDSSLSDVTVFCGDIEPRDPIIVTGNAATIQFTSDFASNGLGFMLTYVADGELMSLCTLFSSTAVYFYRIVIIILKNLAAFRDTRCLIGNDMTYLGFECAVKNSICL